MRWLLVSSMLVVCAICIVRFRLSEHALRHSEELLAECRELGQQIAAARTSENSLATEDAESAEQVTQRVALAARESGFSSSLVSGIFPSLPARIADSDYQQQNTVIRVDRLTLGQLNGFLTELSSNQGFQIGQLSLSATQTQSPAEVWSVEITLTRLIYDPIKHFLPRSG